MSSNAIEYFKHGGRLVAMVNFLVLLGFSNHEICMRHTCIHYIHGTIMKFLSTISDPNCWIIRMQLHDWSRHKCQRSRNYNATGLNIPKYGDRGKLTRIFNVFPQTAILALMSQVMPRHGSSQTLGPSVTKGTW
jgi:hypothetical protein